MVATDRLDQYVALLAIRRSAARRNAFIIGALFAGSVFVGIAVDAFWAPTGNSLFLGTALSIVLALSLAAAMSRYEAINAVSELADELKAR